jgi:hypothetical protein
LLLPAVCCSGCGVRTFRSIRGPWCAGDAGPTLLLLPLLLLLLLLLLLALLLLGCCH